MAICNYRRFDARIANAFGTTSDVKRVCEPDARG